MNLRGIAANTISAFDLEGTAAAYCEHLGYQRHSESRVSESLAALWGCPAQANARQILLQPASKTPFWLRLVEGPEVTHYKPLTTYGWNASEYIVQDVDRLAERLEQSPFEMIGPPADLSFSDAIRATQVLGPAQEVLYLTQFKRPVPEFDVPSAEAFVDRVFINIVGGGNLPDLTGFYNRHLGVPEAPVIEAVISVMSDAFGLPADQQHAIAALSAGGQCFIEADQCPPMAVDRPTEPGFLPPGLAMTSFFCEGQPAFPADFTALSDDGYYRESAAVVEGAAGELIELVR